MPLSRRPWPVLRLLVDLAPILLLLSLLAVRPARAADLAPAAVALEPTGAPVAGAVALSLEDALRRAAANVPVLVRAENELRQVRARRTGAGLWLPQNPYGSFLVGRRRELQPDGAPTLTGPQYAVHVEQAVEVAGQRWTRLRSVEAAAAVAESGLAAATIEARALTSAAYVQAALADRRVAVQRDRADIAAQLLESATLRQRLGGGSGIDVNLARTESGRVLGERRDAEVEREQRLTELRTLIGMVGTPLHLVTSMDPPPPLPSEAAGVADGAGGDDAALAPLAQLEPLINQALRARADLQALRRRQEELAAQASQLRREIAPSPVLSFDLQRDLPGQLFLGGTVGITLPLWNRNQGPLALVSAAEQVRKNEERLLLTRLRNEVVLAHRALVLRREELRAYGEQALGAAADNVDLLRRGWQAGKFDLFRVITAVRELADIRIRYLTILERLWLARIELERAVGSPLDQMTPDLKRTNVPGGAR